jgi:hypothetical protein
MCIRASTNSWGAPASGGKVFLVSMTTGPCGVAIASAAANLSRSAERSCPPTNTRPAAEEALLSTCILEIFDGPSLRHPRVLVAAVAEQSWIPPNVYITLCAVVWTLA